MFFQNQSIVPCIIKYLLQRDINKVDNISRKIASRAYAFIRNYMKTREILEYIDKVTGGIGYRNKQIGSDWERVVILGCYIAWAESASSKDTVLEIGTGLGRTNYCLQYNGVKQIITVDVDPYILGIATNNNPYKEFQQALNNRRITRIVLGDAVVIVNVLIKTGYLFTHIVHDGGPNPGKNPRIFSHKFFHKLDKLLANNGRISIFAGKNPKIVSRIYGYLKNLGYEVYTFNPPGLNVKIVRGVKNIHSSSGINNGFSARVIIGIDNPGLGCFENSISSLSLDIII